MWLLRFTLASQRNIPTHGHYRTFSKYNCQVFILLVLASIVTDHVKDNLTSSKLLYNTFEKLGVEGLLMGSLKSTNMIYCNLSLAPVLYYIIYMSDMIKKEIHA